jgi:hypothetical protein
VCRSRGLSLGRDAGSRVAALLGMTVCLALPLNAQTATFLDYHTSIPSSWTARPASSSSRLAEYVTPGAEVVVYYFGPRMNANVDANAARWRDQFTNAGAGPTFERITRDSSAKFPTTFAEFHGTYRRGIGAGSADSVRSGQALIAAIVDTPRGALFMQIFGPEPRVAAERDAFRRFVTNLK